jgi:L-threonylcarbamoyladenylate synthase
MKDVATPQGVIRLASPTSIDEYARTLYAALRDGDSQGLSTICVIPPSGDGIAIAIRDRLLRASRGREIS